MNNEQRMWSRDWSKMEWKNIKEKLLDIDNLPGKETDRYRYYS